MQHLFNKGEGDNRHDDILRLVSSWRRMGQTQEGCVTLAMKFAPSLGAYEVRRQVQNIFDKGYVYGCQDHIMAKYCDPKCKFFEFKNYKTSVQGQEDIRSILVNDAKLKRKHKYIEMKDILGLNTTYKIHMGELVVIWGDTKLGKSTLLQNIVAQTPNLN
jgi:ABC-type transport system involved in cytochrome bd biosynthesis fused ATPase/permease subunit